MGGLAYIQTYSTVRYGVDSYFANDKCRALGLVCGGWDGMDFSE